MNLNYFRAPYPLEGVSDGYGHMRSFVVGKDAVTSITTDQLGVLVQRSAPHSDVYITPCGFGLVSKPVAVAAPEPMKTAKGGKK